MKCPNCGCNTQVSKDDEIPDFTSFMDKVIKRVSDKQKKELDYGIPDKEKND